jgi:DNA-binding transcriptional LysR family regulator
MWRPFAILMTMELDHIEAFVAIAKQGGFTRASSLLHLSQPAISRRIHLLEQELGAPLFDRLGSGVVINDVGRAFLPHAETLLASIRDGVDAVRALRGEDRGIVTLALVGTLASTTLTDRLRRFRRSHPNVDLRLRTALSREVSALVLCAEATLGLRYETDPSPHLVSTVIHHEPLVLVCSPRHPLARARRVRLDALTAERWLAFPFRPGVSREPYASALAARLAACGLTASDTIVVDSLTAQKRMVEAGFGLALLPESAIGDEVRGRTLHVLSVPALRITVPIVLVYRRHAFQSGATKALVALMSDWSASASSRLDRVSSTSARRVPARRQR